MADRKKARRLMRCENFFAHCDQSGGPDACWPYQGSCCSSGYGTIWVDGRVEQANRFAYMLAVGPIPRDANGKTLCVLHRCDNPPCCNPAHLYAGTQARNAADREARNRGNQPRGEANGAAQLSTRDVIFIRRCADLYTTYELAKMLGVEPVTVNRVITGETWGWQVLEAKGRAA